VGISTALGISLLVLLSGPAAARPTLAHGVNDQARPAQGEQLYTFTSCTAPGGGSCLSPYGGIVTPLQVGTTVALEFFTSAFCTTPISGYINWGDQTGDQPETISSGDCQCTFGPFQHTFNAPGNFTVVISDTCDGAETIGSITVSATADLFSPLGLLVLFGGLLGFGALAGGLVSLRPVRIPPRPPATEMSASPAIAGWFVGTPTGTQGVAQPIDLPIPPPTAGPPPPPSWAYDYRTTPYQPNPLIQGWGELVQRFQAGLNGRPPPPPNWPQMTTPAPPTDWPGTFYQARINPQTGRWSWWNPIDGTFPWG